jgi:urease accessory protein
MGRQTIRIAAALASGAVARPEAGASASCRLDVIGELRDAVDRGATAGHHAVAFGAAAGRAGIDPALAAAAFLHSTCAVLVGAALRLLPIGQVDGQRLLAALRPIVAGLAARAAASDLDDLWSFTPALEIAGIHHADLDARLFRS